MTYACWCGVELTDADLDDMAAELPSTCGGTGTLRCECGGDFCVCHNHGEVDCDGCPDCEWDDAQEVWWCPECRAAGAGDEDGCCTTCGSDCEIRPGEIRAFVHDTDPGDVDPALVGSYVTAALETQAEEIRGLRNALAELTVRPKAATAPTTEEP